MTRLFGTNGIRGVVNQDMNSTLALGIGQAWGTHLKHTIAKPRVALGSGTPPPRIEFMFMESESVDSVM